MAAEEEQRGDQPDGPDDRAEQSRPVSLAGAWGQPGQNESDVAQERDGSDVPGLNALHRAAGEFHTLRRNSFQIRIDAKMQFGTLNGINNRLEETMRRSFRKMPI